MKKDLLSLINQLRSEMKKKFNRHVSIQDLLSDRWETASFYGFGEGTSCYNNVLIIGYGYWGPKLSRNFSNSNNFNLHSICDLSSRKLNDAKKNYPNVKTYSNYKFALKNNKYKLVVISTPTTTNLKIAQHGLTN